MRINDCVKKIIAVIIGACVLASYAESAGKISLIEGKVSVLKKDAETWRDACVNMPLEVGDAVYAMGESFAEIVYTSGAILRMDEETKVIIEAVSDKGIKTNTPVGNVWGNMRKLVTSKKEFELSSPTATAAIRGTVFAMNTRQDSSTDVSVYEGKVAVGPSKEAQQVAPLQSQERHEVPGPSEIPGPYEVTLDQWRTIVAGQMISVNKEGKFAQKKFSVDKASKNSFVKKNLAMDKNLEKEEE